MLNHGDTEGKHQSRKYYHTGHLQNYADPDKSQAKNSAFYKEEEALSQIAGVANRRLTASLRSPERA